MTRALYSTLLYALLPLLLLRLLWRSRRAPAYRERWRERLGFYRQPPVSADIWVHAVSVGEVQAAQPMIRHLLLRDPGIRILVTTTTPTGARRLQELFDERVAHLYCPFDLTPVVRRFLDRVAPRLAIVMETEIWPNLLAECAARALPVLLVNARLSARSARGYAKVRTLARESMGRFRLIAAQTRADAERFIALGVPAERVAVTGSIKFDLQLPASLTDRAEVMRRGWGCNRPIWVAASTHEGEEELLLQAHARLREQLPAALLVLVPRHPDRFERVAGMVQRRGFKLARRSLAQTCDAQTSVYLGDTMGELVSFIAAADVAFVGGSLVPTGGHNLLEAAAVGAPVIVGPHVFNFLEVTQQLLAHQAAVQVQSADELTHCLSRWLTDAAERARIGENGRKAVEANRGALQRLLGLVDPHLDGVARSRRAT